MFNINTDDLISLCMCAAKAGNALSTFLIKYESPWL